MEFLFLLIATASGCRSIHETNAVEVSRAA